MMNRGMSSFEGWCLSCFVMRVKVRPEEEGVRPKFPLRLEDLRQDGWMVISLANGQLTTFMNGFNDDPDHEMGYPSLTIEQNHFPNIIYCYSR
jgi:hypothetical protein